ncbi:amidohydrolase family protein [Daejeonella oryzae]|uniref:amidohydrolase family protein n=1 Tax=Daejeonella oryzae TaxID=1122943 RepID=UPI00041B1F29|nr:amidohydrolase family protein [Daejeonella oryzae]
MIRNFSADYIITVAGEPLKNGVVSVNDEGEIVNIYNADDFDTNSGEVEKHSGVIVPGFVNSHCHLELSHLEGVIPKGLKLIAFIREVLKNRKADESRIIECMEKADKLMYQNGIVAVGDISSTNLSKNIKEKSSIYYHTYVEVLGFDPEKAEDVFNKGLELKNEFYPLSTSLTMHAPYSVSKELFKLFKNYYADQTNLLSLHNQESEEENKLYRYKTGEFIDFYESMDISIDYFKPQARNSLQSVIPLLAKDQKILMVHNTFTSLKDLYFVGRFGRDVSWCFCPNANLHIEGRLPKIPMFMSHDFNITLGTDSFASNDQLDILAEMKAVATGFPTIPLETLIQWSTLNGAKFLGIDQDFGSIEKGKKPGLNLISNVKAMKLSPQSGVQKLI